MSINKVPVKVYLYPINDPHDHPKPCRATLSRHFSSWTFANFLDKWYVNDEFFVWVIRGPGHLADEFFIWLFRVTINSLSERFVSSPPKRLILYLSVSCQALLNDFLSGTTPQQRKYTQSTCNIPIYTYMCMYIYTYKRTNPYMGPGPGPGPGAAARPGPCMSAYTFAAWIY